MDGIRILALALIVAGILALVYRGYSYTTETHEADIGSVQLQVKEKERVNIPVWAGIVAIAAGGGLLLAGGRKV